MTGADVNGADQGAGFEFRPHLQEQMNYQDAQRFVQAFRVPGEQVWVGTFRDAKGAGDAALYEQRNGRPWWRVYGVPSPLGTQEFNGRAETGEHLSPDVIDRERPFQWAQHARCGVFWMVNVPGAEATGPLRGDALSVGRVAAVFVDLDGAPLPDLDALPLPPTAVVESSAGRYHVYWSVHDLPRGEFRAVQQALAAEYGADPTVCDLPRVMRLPGTWHGKGKGGAAPFLSRLLRLDAGNQYTRAEILSAWESVRSALQGAPAAQRSGPLRFSAGESGTAVKFRPPPPVLQEPVPVPEQTRGEGEPIRSAPRAAALQTYADRVRADEVGKVGTAPSGTRNNALNWAAYRLGSLDAAGLDVEGAADELLRAAETAGLDAGEAAETLRSGWAAGAAQPADLSGVGTRAGQSRAAPGMRVTGRAPSAPGLPSAADLIDRVPAPAGLGYTFTPEQVMELLGLDLPVAHPLTDQANAHRILQAAGGDLLFVGELGGFVAWNGVKWDAGGRVGPGNLAAQRLAGRLGAILRQEADQLGALFVEMSALAASLKLQGDQDAPEVRGAQRRAEALKQAYDEHMRAVKGAGSERGISAALTMLRPLCAASVDQFQTRPWVLGFADGRVWARGEVRPAEREDYMLNVAAVPMPEHVPGADQGEGDWAQVLRRITGGDAELARTLQDLAGYALSGSSSLRVLPWLYGTSGTGKGTFSELLATVLGTMSGTLSPDKLGPTFSRDRLGADIWGRRLVMCAEAGNSRLDAELLKTLSGGDRLPVRQLYAEAFTADPVHVLMMVANDPPRVNAYDDALKRRVLAVPFTHDLRVGEGVLLGGRRVESERRDLSSALVREFSAWAVEGLSRVHRTQEIYRAPVVERATREFWQEVDPLREFWLSLPPHALQGDGLRVADMAERLTTWSAVTGYRVGVQKFNRAAESVGLKRVKVRRLGNAVLWRLDQPDLFPVAEVDQVEEHDEQDATGETVGTVRLDF